MLGIPNKTFHKKNISRSEKEYKERKGNHTLDIPIDTEIYEEVGLVLGFIGTVSREGGEQRKRYLEF